MVAIFIATHFVYSGYQVKSIYSSKAQEQSTINRHVVDTTETWDALAPVRDRWDESFVAVTEMVDLFSIMAALDLESTAFEYSVNTVIDGGRSNVTYNNTSLGLVQACIKNNTNGMLMSSTHIPNLLADIRRMEERQNLTFNSLAIRDAGEGVTQIMFDALCVYLRGEDNF